MRLSTAIEIIKFIPKKIVSELRKNYYANKIKLLINKSPTIISRDCFGGLIYHNLSLPFYSPTINLYFSDEDFILFVKELKGYLDAELIYAPDPNKSFPVGTLEYNGKKITINFLHYHSFDEAKQKWEVRKQRVDFSNIYIVMVPDSLNTQMLDEFSILPYQNKAFISPDNPTNNEFVHIIPFMGRDNYCHGQVLSYQSPFSLRRPMDAFDYVSFLNLGH